MLSIAAGVLALGLAFGARGVIHIQLEEDERITKPAHIVFEGGASGRDTFNRDTVDAVMREPGVADAEGLAIIPFRWKLESGSGWQQGLLVARDDFGAIRVGQLELVDGRWPTGRALAVERVSSRYFGVPLGATVVVEFGRGERRLPVQGVVRKPYVLAPQWGGSAAFYATPDTVIWLTGVEGYNRLYVRLTPSDQGEIDQVRKRVEDRLERMGMSTGGVNPTGMTFEFAAHQVSDQIDTMFLVLGVLGVLSLGLSGFLIVNTMNAIVVQQVWQIGVMKVVGATFWRVVRIYITMALVYGGAAVLLAVPLGTVGAYVMAGWMLEMFNVASTGVLRVSPLGIGVQAVVGLAVPVLAAVIPVVGGARVTAHRAISSYGLGGQFGRGPLDRLVGRIRCLPRPMAVSLRNTFRRKARVTLTLLTFTLVGVMFIMVLSVRVSLDNTVEVLLQNLAYDVMVVLSRPYRATRLVEAAASVSGVSRVEVWDLRQAQLSLAGGKEVKLGVQGLPPDSEVLRPRVVSGRGLLPSDGRAILLNNGIAADYAIQVGDEIRLTIAGEESAWTVVGLILNVTPGRDNFVPIDALAREVGGNGRGSLVMLMSEAHDAGSQERLVDDLSDVYATRRVEVSDIQSAHQFRDLSAELFDVISYLLMTMAILAAIVGGIGLMGTLSINVVERWREIGVMRAIGARSFDVAGIFVGEGITLGLLSWLLAVPLSYPGARLFSDAIGAVMFDTPLDYSYSFTGVFIWLTIVLFISTLASLGPALQATKISIREALSYE